MTDFNEKQLEELLQTSLPETSLIENLADINPFRGAVTKVITGMVLTTITLEFLYLNYILPTIGIMLIYLGMRTLRSGNLWFRAGWLAALGKLGVVTVNLLLQVTPYISLMDGWGLWVSQGIHILFLFCLGKGIQKAGLDAGLEHPKMATWPVILWQLVLLVLALGKVSGWAIMILMIYAWVKMIQKISHCADDLETVGYGVPVKPVWFSAKPLLLTYLALLLAAMIGASLLVNYTPVDAEAVNASDVIGASEEAEEIRSELAEAGFPEDVLSGILDKDLLDIGSVAAVDSLFENHNTSNTELMDGWSVSVLTEEGRMKTFIWFEYADGKHAGLVDSVKVQYEEKEINSQPTGRILYEKKGKTYTADLAMEETVSRYLWFGDISTSGYYITKYSFPFTADNPRGYFTYWSEEPDGTPVTWSMNNTNFHCLRTPLVLPYVELPQNMDGVVLFGGFGDGFGQEKFQIYATPDFDRE